MEPVPFLWYRETVLEDVYEYAHQEIPDYARAQLLVKFLDQRRRPTVLVARVIIDQFRDFCGGSILRSPQVICRAKNDWNAGESFWEQGGHLAGPLSWADLEQGNITVPDLGIILGKDTVTVPEATEWAYRQMALAVFGHMRFSGKRMIHCNGTEEGTISRLVRTMSELANGNARMLANTCHVSGVVGGPNHAARALRVDFTCVDTPAMDGYETDPFRNPNSGSTCIGWTLVLESMEDEYPSDVERCRCGWYNPTHISHCQRCDAAFPVRANDVSEVTQQQIRPAYTSLDYSRTLSRALWRNG